MSATRSPTLFAGTAGLTVSKAVEVTASVTGSKSRMGSYGILSEECRGYYERAERKKQRIAIRHCLCRLTGADIAGRTGNVLYIKLFAQALAEFLRHEPSEAIGDAAWWERYECAYRPRRIGLCAPDARTVAVAALTAAAMLSPTGTITATRRRTRSDSVDGTSGRTWAGATSLCPAKHTVDRRTFERPARARSGWSRYGRSRRTLFAGPGTGRAHRARRQGTTQTNVEPRRNVASRAHRAERGGRKAKDHGAVAARRQRHATAAAYVPLSFAPGTSSTGATKSSCWAG